MNYIEILTIESEKFYIECESLAEAKQQFWQLLNEQNKKKFIVFEQTATSNLFSIKVADIKSSTMINQDELPLTRKPKYVSLLSNN